MEANIFLGIVSIGMLLLVCGAAWVGRTYLGDD